MHVSLPELIQKEAIRNYLFDPVEPRINAKEIEKKLFQAMVMGNTWKKKVTIYFHTTEGIKKVKTTVWGLTPENVLLKSGINILENCITDIDLD
jgi:hypothetical protein